MGYVQKNRMYETEDGRPYTMIGRYKVIKNSEHMTGIYVYNDLITSKPKWSQAIKLAKLLYQEYREGYEDGRDDHI
jgi:hypothetical protein